MTANLVKVNSTKSLFNHILPIHERLWRRNLRTTFLMNFNELIPKSSVLLQCKEQQLCSLIMISIPDHLKESATVCYWTKRLFRSEKEPGRLSYAAGYVLYLLRKKSSNDELQALIQTMMCPSSKNTNIETRRRGGLVTLCNILVKTQKLLRFYFANSQSSSQVW